MSLPDLKTIYDRCEPEGDCLLWTGHRQSGGHPSASHNGHNMLVRRRAFELANGYLPDGRARTVTDTCRNKLCCNAEHLVDMSRSALVKRSYVQTRVTAHEYPRRLAARLKRGGIKLNLDVAREVRASAGRVTSKAEGERLGCSASLICKIRSGEIWREGAANSSVFHFARSKA